MNAITSKHEWTRSWWHGVQSWKRNRPFCSHSKSMKSCERSSEGSATSADDTKKKAHSCPESVQLRMLPDRNGGRTDPGGADGEKSWRKRPEDQRLGEINHPLVPPRSQLLILYCLVDLPAVDPRPALTLARLFIGVCWKLVTRDTRQKTTILIKAS